MSPEALQSFLALAIGFSFAGAMSTGYQLAAARPASFRMLAQGPSPAAIAAVPFLVFAAPFLIVRTVVRAGLAGPQHFGIVTSNDRVCRHLEPDVRHRSRHALSGRCQLSRLR